MSPGTWRPPTWVRCLCRSHLLDIARAFPCVRSTSHGHSQRCSVRPTCSMPAMNAMPSVSHLLDAWRKVHRGASGPLCMLHDARMSAFESPRSATDHTTWWIGGTRRCHRKRFGVDRISSKVPSEALRGGSDVVGRTNGCGGRASNALEGRSSGCGQGSWGLVVRFAAANASAALDSSKSK